jgi:glycosyltransferase involved in cell wall biosynthesis
MLSYNHADFIESSIMSICCQKEYISDIEIIIIDDGSTDGTIELIKKIASQIGDSISLRPYFLEHTGISAISNNLQKLIDLATKRYVCFISSDDTYVPNAFKEQIEIMQKEKEIKGVFADGINVFQDGTQASSMGPKDKKILSTDSVDKVLSYITNNTPSLFIQSCIVDSLFIKSYQAFDLEMIADDWVFNIRFFSELKKSNSSFHFMDKPVFMRNLHGDNTSRNILSQYARIRQVSERYCSSKEMIKAQAFWYSFYIGARNKDFKSIRTLLGRHFDSASVFVPSIIELLKLIFAKILKR